MKFILIVLVIASYFIGSCMNTHPHYIITYIDIKLANIDSLFPPNKYKNDNDSNNCVVLMLFTLGYPDGSKHVLYSDIPYGMDGILYKIKKVELTGPVNIASIKGFTFSDYQFTNIDFHSSNYHRSFGAGLITFKDLNKMVLSINNKERKSDGSGIGNSILFSVPCKIKATPFAFKMYFENGDSLVKQFDLKDSSVLEVKNYKSR